MLSILFYGIQSNEFLLWLGGLAVMLIVCAVIHSKK